MNWRNGGVRIGDTIPGLSAPAIAGRYKGIDRYLGSINFDPANLL
jgi:hypothetical protein